LDSAGNVTGEKVYDAGGNLKRSVSHAYDAVNRLVQDVGSLGQTTTYERDSNGNVIGVTDPNGLKTVNGFDALNRLASRIDPANGTTQTARNPDDSVAQVTDPRGLATRYGYDGLGNPVSVNSPDSGTTTRTFDANGNVKTSTDARGKTTTNTYDKLNRLTRQQFSDGYAAYTYDQGVNGIGHLTTLLDGSGTTTWTYDRRGHVLQKKQKTGVATLTTTNTYDPATGKLASTVLPSGQTLAYQYDPASGLPSEIDIGGQPLIRAIQYQPFGPVAAWIQGSGVALHHARSFDLDGYLSGLSFANSAATGGVETIGLARDPGGRITQITDNTVPTKLFDYDALGEIKDYNATGVSQSYLYDANGNRTQLTSITSAASTANYTIDHASNRLLSRNVNNATVTNYTLDAAGNLITDGIRSFTISGSGHLANVKIGSALTAYSTNGLGERQAKKSVPPGTMTLFTQDANGNLTGEYAGAGTPLQETVYLGNLPVGVIQASAVYYVNPDHLGAPRAVTGNTGAPVWAWDRDPFGNGQPSASGGFVYNLRLPGQYYDAETGLFHNNARNYDPVTGRYIQSDLIGLAGGLNTYAYVANNPINWIDPFGLLVYASLDTGTNTLTLTDVDIFESVTVTAFTGGHIDIDNGLIFSPGSGSEVPAPNGSYLITDNPNYRLDHPDWFGLMKKDDRIDDYFYNNGKQRGGARLHGGRMSFGCVTINTRDGKEEWNKVLKLLQNTNTNKLQFRTGPHWWNSTGTTNLYGTLNIK
jgi:RHS repeat-associated protein